MATQSRKHRAMRTQLVIAQHLAAHGWPYAESTGSGRSGSDILGVPGLAIEIKARANFDPMAWVKQAAMNKGLPMVMFRPNGMGEATIQTWPVILRMSDVIDLLHAAGYGTPGAPPDVRPARDPDVDDATLASPIGINAMGEVLFRLASGYEGDPT